MASGFVSFSEAPLLNLGSVAHLGVREHPPILDRSKIRYQLPQNNDGLFVGRLDILGEVHRRFARADGAAVSERGSVILTACKGMGGVGKSWIATRFLHIATYVHKLFFNAENRESLETQYVTLALQLRLLVPEDLKTVPRAEVLLRVKDYLESLSEPMLLVYDNATHYDALKHLLPRKGDVLITTREGEWPEDSKLDVDVMSVEDASALVRKILGEAVPADEVERLITTLGRLPLAITQACAFVRQTGISIPQYLSLYQSLKEEMLADKTLEPGHRHENVWLTFTLAMRKILEVHPPSINLLNYAGFLAAAPIPRSLLEYISHHAGFFASAVPEALIAYAKAGRDEFSDEDREAFDRALAVVENYSLFHFDYSNKTLAIHRVVQDVIRTSIKNRDIHLNLLSCLIFGTAGDSYHAYAGERQNTTHYRQLLPHLEEIARQFDVMEIRMSVKKEVLTLIAYGIFLNQFAVCVGELGNPRRKKMLLKRAVEILEADPDNPERVKALENLGNACCESGDPLEGKGYLQQALALHKSSHGENDLDFARTLSNLAIAHGLCGDLRAKKGLLEQALSIQEAIYTKDPNDTARMTIAFSLCNLGRTHEVLRNEEAAKECYERALPILRDYYGKRHILVLRNSVNLANARRDCGEVGAARDLLEETLPFLETYYGKGHIELVPALNALAEIYKDLKKPKREQEVLEHVLAIERRHYGDGHIKLAGTMSRLALTEESLGNFSSALSLLKKAEIGLSTQPGFNVKLLRDMQRHLEKKVTDPYQQARHLARENDLENADRIFQMCIQEKQDPSVMADYANFLIQRRHAVTEASPYLYQVREASENSAVTFSEADREGLDETLQVLLDHRGVLKLSAWVLATWLLVNKHIREAEVIEAATLLEEWVSHHISIPDSADMRDASRYLLGHAALLINFRGLAVECFTCVKDLPEETAAILLSLGEAASTAPFMHFGAAGGGEAGDDAAMERRG